MNKNVSPIFITGTDTGVGKTMATGVLAVLLQEQGYRVGVFKPVQCGGSDAADLKKVTGVDDVLEVINPCFSPTPASPHVAFDPTPVDKNIILQRFAELRARYDVVLVEGAGGLLVPLTSDYLVVDLIREMRASVVVVSRLGLGTINHTLLTVRHLQSEGLPVKGVLFSDTNGKPHGLPEMTNPDIIARLAGVPVLGTIPFLSAFTREAILDAAPTLDIQPLLGSAFSSTERLQNWDKKYVWHPFTQMRDWEQEEPLVVERGEGVYLYDTDGNRYIDGVSSLWVTVHGHRKAEIDDAVKAQLNKISHSTMLGLTNAPAVELAKKLVEITPAGLDKAFYSDNGSTSVEVAIKMAFQYWQNTGRTEKTKIAHLANSYHGDTLGSVSVGGIPLFHQVYGRLTFEALKLAGPSGDSLRPCKDFERRAWELVERGTENLRRNKDQVAALVLEPLVQGAAGMLVWPEGALKRWAEICAELDILLIADEVATGFGRTGRMFACEHEDVVPDFLCLSKGLTGGYLPLAATLTTQRVYDGFHFPYEDMKAFFHGHTYTGNPLACAAALANIKLFETERVLENLTPKINALEKALQMFYNCPFVGDIRQKGFMAGIELVADRATGEPFPWQQGIGVKVCRAARNYGVILRPLGNVIVLMPPLSIREDELETLLSATYRAIGDVLGK